MSKRKKLNAADETLSGSQSDDLILTGDVMLDLSNYGAGCETLSIAPLDTITISGIDTGTIDMSTITLPSTNYGTIATGGSGGYSTGTLWSSGAVGSGSTGYTFSNINSHSNVDINTKGIDIREGGDIKIDGKSLKTFMDKMEQRLAILVPDPEKLEKFEALKKAYEHYKTMESLCFPEKENPK